LWHGVAWLCQADLDARACAHKKTKQHLEREALQCAASDVEDARAIGAEGLIWQPAGCDASLSIDLIGLFAEAKA
jgi:hypothetical protein